MLDKEFKYYIDNQVNYLIISPDNKDSLDKKYNNPINFDNLYVDVSAGVGNCRFV